MGEEGLHPKRLKVLRFLARLGPGTRPSVAEVAAAAGLRSTQTAFHHLRVLEREGYIERGEAPAHQRRPVALTDRGWEALGRAPLLGRVAAGRGLEAIAVGDEAYSLMAELLMPRGGGRSRYLLRVNGQSMTGAWIDDGSILVIEEDEDPPDGEVVVALLRDGEEVTVKRLFREGENIRLRAENEGHGDILVPAEDIVVQGRVVSVIHPPKRA